jgi:hypothetical protein
MPLIGVGGVLSKEDFNKKLMLAQISSNIYRLYY